MPAVYNDGPTRTSTILSGQSLGDAIDFVSLRPAAIIMPAGWDAAALTVQASIDGINFANLYDKDGNEYTIQAALGRIILLPIADFLPFRALKLRSGTSGAAVPQTADRAFTLVGVS